MAFELPLPPTPVLESERLILRPVELRDAPAMFRGFADWEVIRYLRPEIPWPLPEEDVEKNVRESLEKRERGEEFFWVITLKGGDDQPIGRIDLRPNVEGRDMRGFWLARDFWGQGLMTEAAERVTQYAFEELAWPFLYVNNAAGNLASHRIKEKQGAVLVDREPFAYREGPGERVIWRIDREDWLARRRASPRPPG